MAATTQRVTKRYTESDYNDFAHTGPGTLAGRYMRLFWQPVLRAEDLPVGRAIPITIMGEQFTLYRGEGGSPHVVEFRCAHRGTQLAAGWVEGDCIRCFYHGWKYDSTGQCVEQPAEDPAFASKIRIRSYPTEEYLGLIFAYLGERGAPALPQYPKLEDKEVVEVRTYTRRCNFFQHLENLGDPLHVPFVHGTRWAYGRGNWRPENLPSISVEESDWGLIERVTHPDGSVHANEYPMPNIAFYPADRPHHAGDDTRSDSIRWKVPIDDERHRDFSVYLLPRDPGRHKLPGRTEAQWEEVSSRADELAVLVLSGRLGIEEAESIAMEDVHFGGRGANIGVMQDAVAQIGQGVVYSRDAHEHLGRSDVGVVLKRKLWARELRALAEGRPLKSWKPSEVGSGRNARGE